MVVIIWAYSILKWSRCFPETNDPKYLAETGDHDDSVRKIDIPRPDRREMLENLASLSFKHQIRQSWVLPCHF